jgi:hypothetical protein
MISSAIIVLESTRRKKFDIEGGCVGMRVGEGVRVAVSIIHFSAPSPTHPT